MQTPEFRYCADCHIQQVVVDEFDTDLGDADPRTWHVVILDCGHSIEHVVKAVTA